MSTSPRRFGSLVSFCLSSEWWLRMTVALSNTSAREVNAFSPFLNPRTASTSTATLSLMSVNEHNLEVVNVLLPTAGDSTAEVSDTEYVPEDPDEGFEPAGSWKLKS
ncbi:hypothetical protein T09_11254 [Trichinella sp. T9]|nr:hypothetical protein T09_11254 [Trichinella sp. T9]